MPISETKKEMVAEKQEEIILSHQEIEKSQEIEEKKDTSIIFPFCTIFIIITVITLSTTLCLVKEIIVIMIEIEIVKKEKMKEIAEIVIVTGIAIVISKLHLFHELHPIKTSYHDRHDP